MNNDELSFINFFILTNDSVEILSEIAKFENKSVSDIISEALYEYLKKVKVKNGRIA